MKAFQSFLGKFSTKYNNIQYVAKQWYSTISLNISGKVLQDTTSQYLSAATIGLALDAVDNHTQDVVVVTGHSLQIHDVIRWQSAPFSGIESQIAEIIDANTIRLANKLPSVPAGSEAFDQLKFVTPAVDANGNQLVLQGSRAPVDHLDVGYLIPTGILAIPDSGSAPLDVVAALAANATEVQFISDIGFPTDLFANGVFHTHLPLTPDEKATVSLNAGDVIALRASGPAAIDDATSFIQINFIG